MVIVLTCVMLYPSHRSEGQYIFESNNEVVAIDAEQFIKIKQERDQVEQKHLNVIFVAGRRFGLMSFI